MILNIDQLRALVALPTSASRVGVGHIFYEYHDIAIADELVELGLVIGYQSSQRSLDHKAYRRSQRGDFLVAEMLAFSNRLMEEVKC